MRRGWLPVLIFGVAMTAGCAPKSRFPTVDERLARDEARKQQAVAIRTYIRYKSRLDNVAFRVMAGNAELCGAKVRWRFGGLSLTIDHYAPGWREAARATLGIGARPKVVYVVKGSPAHLAGMAAGDRILRLNGESLGTGKAGNQKLVDAMRNSEGAELALTVERRGEERTFSVKPVVACDYPLILLFNDAVNAWADGEKIYITTGMLRFVENDEEIALIIGHELAHNTRGHVAAKRGNVLLGAILGAAVSVLSGVDVTDIGARSGAGTFSQDFEAEADYVGVYHVGRAGYDVRKAASFWRRLGASNPAAIYFAGGTHPSTAKRFLALDRAVAEFERKREKGLPLFPDERAKK